MKRRIPGAALLSGILSLAVATPAAALLDVTMAVPLVCEAAPIAGSIGGANVTQAPSLCNGNLFAPVAADVYVINLPTDQEITVSLTGPVYQLALLAVPADENSCIAYAPHGTDPSLTACLPAGDYVVLVSTGVDLMQSYQIGVTCLPCEPVPANGRTWGGLKASYFD